MAIDFHFSYFINHFNQNKSRLNYIQSIIDDWSNIFTEQIEIGKLPIMWKICAEWRRKGPERDEDMESAAISTNYNQLGDYLNASAMDYTASPGSQGAASTTNHVLQQSGQAGEIHVLKSTKLI
ncbi:hypothetical protein ACO0K9_12850 [Undibacterium sp. Ji50W]|uniref:hypothetical protein n=1 Tax=Undibacterium sp. Ji50W TaxID=3413041 RepID=UPI003BF05B3C